MTPKIIRDALEREAAAGKADGTAHIRVTPLTLLDLLTMASASERYRVALEFFATESVYEPYGPGNCQEPEVMQSGLKIAREALKETPRG